MAIAITVMLENKVFKGKYSSFDFEGIESKIEEVLKYNNNFLKSVLTTSQTSLLQTAIAAVEGIKIKVSSEDELVKRDGYRDPELQDYEIDVAKSYNEALSKVVELLKGGIEII